MEIIINQMNNFFVATAKREGRFLATGAGKDSKEAAGCMLLDHPEVFGVTVTYKDRRDEYAPGQQC